MLVPKIIICPINKVMDYVKSGEANAVLSLLNQSEIRLFSGKILSEVLDYEFKPGNNFEGIYDYIPEEDWKIVEIGDSADNKNVQNAPNEQNVSEAINFGTSEIDKGKKLLVHCQMGFSRSPAITYLILCNYMDPQDAINETYKIRPNIKPNADIVAIGDQLLNLNGLAIKALNDRQKVKRILEESFVGWY